MLLQWEKIEKGCKLDEIGCSESFSATSVGKDWKSCESGANWSIPSHSGPLRWEKIGKVVNQAKLAIPSHSEPLRWEKIGKVANQVKLAVLSHSEPLRWEKIGKFVNGANLAIPSHSEPLRWEKMGKVANWAKFAIPSHSEPKCHVDLRSNFFIPITDTYNLLLFGL